MLWKLRRKSIIIPAELHEKLAQNCERIDQVDSQVLRVRPAHKKAAEKKRVEPACGVAVCYGH